MDVRDLIKLQPRNTQQEFQDRTKSVILQFAEQSLNASLFYENPDPRSYISMVPTSAATGDGMGNLMALIVELTQTALRNRLVYADELHATVLEVEAIPGYGTTIDVILVNGTLREGDTIVLAGTDGPIVTQIRSLLLPQPMKELRVKNTYTENKIVRGTRGNENRVFLPFGIVRIIRIPLFQVSRLRLGIWRRPSLGSACWWPAIRMKSIYARAR